MLEPSEKELFFNSVGRSETAGQFGFYSWTIGKAEKACLNLQGIGTLEQKSFFDFV
ncbi:hypothetical protein ABET51_04055 [Metabacillus fastidiosus]|uniref:hypothetical protein n=1 Tax=Metabacillus fastidiosus TaxID=1458 RepID=UPI003D2C0E7E